MDCVRLHQANKVVRTCAEIVYKVQREISMLLYAAENIISYFAKTKLEKLRQDY